jgi:hypothetical protein
MAHIFKTTDFKGTTWLRRGLRNLMVHAEGDINLVNICVKVIVANDDNYALAA